MDAQLRIYSILLFAVALAGLHNVEGRTKKEDKLIKQILRNMTKSSKPLRLPIATFKKRSAPVDVAVDFGLSTVSDVNADGGYVDLEGTMTLMWMDPRLRFDNPKVLSSSIQTVRANPETIWTPDIELYRPMGLGLQTLTNHPLAVVSRTGNVFLATQVRMRTPCDVMGQLEVSNIVNCTLKLGSLTYNGFEMQPHVSPVTADKLHDFQGTGLWTATSATAWAGADSYACCPETFPYIRFSFLFKKRSDGSLVG